MGDIDTHTYLHKHMLHKHANTRRNTYTQCEGAGTTITHITAEAIDSIRGADILHKGSQWIPALDLHFFAQQDATYSFRGTVLYS